MTKECAGLIVQFLAQIILWLLHNDSDDMQRWLTTDWSWCAQINTCDNEAPLVQNPLRSLLIA